MKKSIKAVSTSTYIHFPKWLDEPAEYKEFVVLDDQVSVQDVDSFIIGLFYFNNWFNLGDAQESFQFLLQKMEEGIILGGGLLFSDGTQNIPPSCCCGLEDWREQVDGCLNNRSPWLGHQPSPSIQFTEEKIYVWPNDYTGEYDKNVHVEKMTPIEYEPNTFRQMILNIEKDIVSFVKGPLTSRIHSLCRADAGKIIDSISSWLSI